MARQKQREESAYTRLVRAAQALAKTFDRSAASPRANSPGRELTEFAALAAELAAAEKLLDHKLVELAMQVMEESQRARDALRLRLDELKEQRADIELRRQELARAAEGWDWKIVHREHSDHLGPFTLEHDPETSVIKLGSCRLALLRCPSGEEVFAAARAERTRLEAAARESWDRVKSAALLDPGEEAVTWTRLKAALDSKEMPFKKHEASVLFALALAREGLMEPGATLQTRPPSLSQQKEAISLPRIAQPGNSERVYAVRIEAMPAAI